METRWHASILALLLLLVGAPTAIQAQLQLTAQDCACACCEGDSCDREQLILTGGPDSCTAETCRSRANVCPEGEGEVRATYFDCLCGCCGDASCESPHLFHYDAEGDRDRCNEVGCWARSDLCLDPGSHQGSIIQVAFAETFEGPLDSTGPRDCACACCEGDSCDREQLILTGGPDSCTAETCRSRANVCPEGEGEVRATYFDCLCGCCGDASCESPHLFHYDAEGDRDRCNEVGCWARSDLCLDPGSHQGSIIQVAFAETFEGPLDSTGPRDCACACCEGDSCDREQLILTGGPDSCTAETCRSRANVCPEGEGEVRATYFDCLCGCCGDASCESPHLFHYDAEGDRDRCNEVGCWARSDLCLDPGSHQGSIIQVAFAETFEGPLDSTGPRDCACACCEGDSCDREQLILTGGPDSCTAETCRSRANVCPEGEGEVRATYFDCLCGCCGDASCESPHLFHYDAEGDRDRCNEVGCWARSDLCLDPGSHQGSIIQVAFAETFEGPLDSTGPRDCACACCEGDSCDREQLILTGGPDSCTAETCRSRANVCPEGEGEVRATYFDCLCGCCGDASCESPHLFHYDAEGDRDRCNEVGCWARSDLCLDPGSHQGSIIQVAFAETFEGPLDSTGPRDCACACCEGDSCDREQLILTGGPDSCTAETCRSRANVCPEGEGEVRATYFDCLCGCCGDASCESPHLFHYDAEGDRDRCNEHGSRDCACACCEGDSCDREQLILTGGPDSCTAETCRSRANVCPEGEGEVRATYFDCLCGCCGDASCESPHLFHYDAEGDRDRCNEVGCWARSDLCLDPGSHQGSIIQVAFAETFEGPLDSTGPRDCACACCEGDSCDREQLILTGGPDSCTAETCRSRANVCPEGEGEVRATYFDCLCGCCGDASCESPHLFHYDAEGDRDRCNEVGCWARSDLCLDPGSHQGSIIQVAFAETFEGPLDSTGPRDCACACCEGDSCDREQLILTGGPDSCTAETCRSRANVCPEGEGEVRATYFDCLCGCCGDASCESPHLFHYDAEGDRDRCNEVGCWARSDLCLDPGSHQGSIIQVAFAETFEGPLDSTGPRDCACACCEGDSCDREQLILTGGPDSCTAETCRSRANVCPEGKIVNV
eukprot:jgi/Pico_ML_1/56028/g1626.t1